jgi:hypothetical protein
MYTEDKWRETSSDIFWGEIAPCDHVVQIYENEYEFIDMLAGFVNGGIVSGDGVIVIATKAHRKALEEKLKAQRINIDSYLYHQYFPIDAEVLLSTFMVNGWPDEKLFMRQVADLLKIVRMYNRKVRAFGEMVAILWAQGHNGATVQLERLWNKFCEKEMFCLLCAYPNSGFTSDIHTSMEHICSAHSKMIAPSQSSPANLLYTRVADNRKKFEYAK